MAVGRDDRRNERRDQVVAVFGAPNAEPALDLLELFEFAWHDCYGEITPADRIIDDVLVLSRGALGQLISAAHLALTDWRDARIAADALRR